MKCRNCQRAGHTAKNCPGLPGGVPTPEMWDAVESREAARRLRGRCGKCGERGHTIRTCPQLQR